MVPDIIISPHAIPSRMTIGQLMEMLGGKLKALSGKDVDATAFTDLTIDDIGKQLPLYGYDRHGNERMICGKTGELMECRVFIGPTSYQRLRHIASMKIHSRSTGPVAILTRQPLEGRSRGGGLRFGVGGIFPTFLFFSIFFSNVFFSAGNGAGQYSRPWMLVGDEGSTSELLRFHDGIGLRDVWKNYPERHLLRWAIAIPQTTIRLYPTDP